MPRLFFVDYSTTMHRRLSRRLYFFFSSLFKHHLVSWVFIHVLGICIALLLNRLGALENLGLVPSLPSSAAREELSNFETSLFFFGLLFLAPCSVVIILSARLLESGVEYMAVPISNSTTISRAIFNRVGNLVFQSLPSQLCPQWINIPFRLIIKMSESFSTFVNRGNDAFI